MCVGSAWIFNFIVVEVTPVATPASVWKRRRLTTIKGVYFFFPETNGRHFEEVDQIFIQNKTVFDSVPVARHMDKGQSGPALDIEKHEVEHSERGEWMRRS